MIHHFGVREGRIGLNRMVELLCTNPAKLFGLYPRKGTIAVGSDADLVVFDPEKRHTITAVEPAVEDGLQPLRGNRGRGRRRDGAPPRPRDRRGRRGRGEGRRRAVRAARAVRRAAARGGRGGGRLVGRLDLVIGIAVAAVAVVATVDAVRSRDAGEAPAETTELAERDALSGRLAALGAKGELVVYEGGCRRRVLVLPSLEQTVDSRACALRGAVSPDGRLVARCGGELTEVFDVPDGSPNDAVPGCTPAWRPDGMLTVAQDRAVVGFGSCSGGSAVPGDAHRAGRAPPGGRPSSERAGAARPSARSRRRDRLGLRRPRGRAALDPNGRAARRRRRPERDRLLRGRPARAGSTDVHAHDRRPAGCEPARPLRDADARRDSPPGREPGEPARASA